MCIIPPLTHAGQSYLDSPVDDSDPNRANQASEQVILEIAQPYGNHNGGALVFGPDGYLYVGLGDGGSGGDPQGHGQNLGTLLGSIIRIDPRRSCGRQTLRDPHRQSILESRRRPRRDLCLRSAESLEVQLRSGNQTIVGWRRRSKCDRGDRHSRVGAQLWLEHYGGIALFLASLRLRHQRARDAGS